MARTAPLRYLTLSTALTAVLAASSPAIANPVGGTVSAGAAVISEAGKTLTVTQSTDKAVIDWRGFDIGADETTHFQQPNSNSLTLNRVGGGNASQILGTLTANGNVMVVNPNGVVFGKGSKVDVNGIVATTSDISNDKFMAGNLTFDKPGKADASIINEGTITAKQAGLVGFVAPNVVNRGVITAQLGRVQLASGDTMTVDLYGDKLMEVGVSDAVKSQLVENTGVIQANGGQIALTAAAGKQIVNSLIVARGELKSAAVGTKNGQIVIYAEGSNSVSGNVSADKGKKAGSSTVIVDGALNASGNTGGTIKVLGDNVTVKTGSTINASGVKGGGTINVGGQYHGEGATPTAKNVTIEKGATLTADATTLGNGGTVTVWSDDRTDFLGSISARGGAYGGNAGFVETSGLHSLLFDGAVDTSAARGNYGTLLLDPTDITISNAANSASMTNTSGTYADTTLTPSNLNVTTLQNLLGTSNVIVSTTSSLGGNGDITIIDPITWSSLKSLTLNAARDVNINANINSTNTSGGSFTVNAARNITQQAGTTLNFGGGAISLNAAGGSTTGLGQTILNGVISIGSGSLGIVSGLDSGGNRADITFTSSNLVLKNATLGSVNITGYRDMTFTRSLPSASSVTLTAFRDLTVGDVSTGSTSAIVLRAANNVVGGNGQLILNGVLNLGSGTVSMTSGLDSLGNRRDQTFTSTNWMTQGAGVSTVGITGFRDLTFSRSLVSSGNISLTAFRDLSVSDLTTGSGGTLTLNAAGGAVGNIGLLILNSILNLGTGAISMTSGTDINGVRRDQNFTSLNWVPQAGTGSVGAVTITGFRDITFSNNINSVGAVSLTAYRDLSLQNVTNGISSSLTLNASIGGTGHLNLNGVLNLGSGTVTLLSGADSTATRRDMTFDSSNLLYQNGGLGTVSIGGFRDLTITRDLISSGNVTLTAYRNLSLGNVTNGTTSSMALYAGANNPAAYGHLILNGLLTAGSGNLQLTSGIDNVTSARRDQTFTTSNLAFSNGGVTLLSMNGFGNLTLSRDIAASSTVTLISYGNLTLNNALSNGTTSGITLHAGGGLASGIGHVILSGSVTIGSGSVNILSGVDGSGNRADITLTSSNFTPSSGSFGSMTINGFRDLTFTRDIASTAGVAFTAYRNLSVGNVTAANGISLLAANSVATAVGWVNVNGVLTLGTGGLTIVSSLDNSGNRRDMTFTSSNFVLSGSTGGISINGYRDLTFTTDIVSSGNINITAYRDLTVKNVTTGSINNLGLYAAGNSTTGIGHLILNGNLSSGTGSLSLTSGVDSASNGRDMAFTSTNLVAQSASGFGTTNILGFRDVSFGSDLISFSGIRVIAQRNLTVQSVATGSANSLTLQAANGSASGLGQLIINGALSAGTNATGLILVSGVDSAGNRVDKTFISSNLVALGGGFGSVTISGFRDLTFTGPLTSLGTISVTANRNLTVGDVTSGSTSAINLYAAGGSASEIGYLVLNGVISVGTGGLNLTSGVNSSGVGRDVIFTNSNLIAQSTFGATAIQGFRDITFTSDFVSLYGVKIAAQRNLTVQSVTSGALNSLTLTAANNNANGLGQLLINGTLTVGRHSTGFVLTSGVDASGNRLDKVFTSSNLILPSGTAGPVTITGFRDITLDTALVTTTSALIHAYGTLKIGTNGSITNTTADTTMRVNLVGDGGFINQAGTGAINSTVPWRIYTTSPSNAQYGGLTANSVRYSCTYGSCPNITSTVGNTFAYSYTPILTVTPVSLGTYTIGTSVPNLNNYQYIITGYLPGDTGDVVTGSLNGQTNYTTGSVMGTYTVSYSSGSLTSSLGYGFNYASNPTAITLFAVQIPDSVQRDLQGSIATRTTVAATSTTKPVRNHQAKNNSAHLEDNDALQISPELAAKLQLKSSNWLEI